MSVDPPEAALTVLPYVVASISCDGCSSGYVTTRSPDDPVPETALAGEWAGQAGWLQNAEYPSGWRCPKCRERYGDNGSPRRFTLREVLDRRRARNCTNPDHPVTPCPTDQA